MDIKTINAAKSVLSVDNSCIKIAGIIDEKMPAEYMKPFFNNVHDEILKNKHKNIIIDITNLEFLNSAGIRELINWVVKIDTLAIEDKYKINFLCNKNNLWQESSISTIAFLNREYITVKII
jgi:hypothetical protein